MKWPHLMMFMLFLWGMFSCEKTSPETEVPWPLLQKTSAGNFTASLQPQGGKQIKQNEHFSLEIALSPEGLNTNSEPRKIVVSADMPAHSHGMNTKPETVKIAPGKYRIDGMLFHMAGDWVVSVRIDPGNGQWEQADFPILIE